MAGYLLKAMYMYTFFYPFKNNNEQKRTHKDQISELHLLSNCDIGPVFLYPCFA